ncbi:MAG: hypothetical protein U1E05_00085 [Patescibacteria group bacterium]|nr:hypothetical protein [Patescibacteria group bacterium]
MLRAAVLLLSSLIVSLCPSMAPAAERLYGERLLPATTVGYVAIEDVNRLADHWNMTQLGKLMQDPVMAPFAEDLRRQFKQRWSRFDERLGLTIDDLKGVPSGEIVVATIQPGPQDAAMAVLVDVTGNTEAAQKLLEKVSATLLKEGAKRQTYEVLDTTVIVFELPEPPIVADAGTQPTWRTQEAEPSDTPAEPRLAIYFLTSKVLGVSDDLDVIKGILSQLAKPDALSLENVAGFREVMTRCEKDAGRQQAQIRWYLSPIPYAEAVRAASPSGEPRRGKDMLDVFREQGFRAIQAMGGFVDFAEDGHELIHRTAIFAPPPYAQAMQMLSFPNSPDFKPQSWVPSELATYTTLYCDIQNAFDHFGPLFDELFGGAVFLFAVSLDHEAKLAGGELAAPILSNLAEFGIELPAGIPVRVKEPGGAWEVTHEKDIFIVRKMGGELRMYQKQVGLWEDVLEGLRTDPKGPQLDLRKDLIDHLGPRVSVLSDFQLPITPSSERLLFAIETGNPEQVAKAIAKSMKNDPTARRVEINGYEVWEIVEEEEIGVGVPEIQLGSLPPLGNPLKAEDDDMDEEEEEQRLLPHAAVTVAHGQLLVASHLDFLEKILKPGDGFRPLSADVDYRVVQAELNKLGIDARCVQVFSRTDEEYRPTYELVRQGKMPESETLLARILNAGLGTGKRHELRKQKIDGSKLPDYEVVRRHLGPAGTLFSSLPDGWFIKGAMLTKGTQ